MADPADSAAPRRPRVTRGASSTRRASSASSVSTETENKLARAVQSAQRLAQLADVPRDDSTLDLFPDDPTRALVESMTIDVRQGTLSGFELPAVVRAAVEAAHGANASAGAASMTPRRAARSKGTAGEASDASATVTQIETAAAREPESDDAAMSAATVADEAQADNGSVATRGAVAADRAAEAEANANVVAAGSAPPRTGAAGGVLDTAQSAEQRARDDAPHAGGALPLRDAVAAGTAAAMPAISPTGLESDERAPEAAGASTPHPERAAPSIDAPLSPGRAAAQARAARASVTGGPKAAATPFTHRDGRPKAGNAADAQPPLRSDTPAASADAAFAAAARAESFAPSPSRTARSPVASPELDRARATAFADTVDALYGVIADQRRAAAELTRRMKWMVAIVAGALAVTVGVGVTQTLLLSRLARDTAAQQQRTEQMLQTQQAALAGMLARVAAPVPAPAPAVPGAGTAAERPASPAPASRHPSRARRVHSPAH